MDDLACPRCSAAGSGIVARSPIAGVWVMYLCGTCFYGWRSTEPDYATKADAMARQFRIDPAQLPRGHVMPQIPKLRGAN